MNLILLIGALLGITSVMMAAYVDHLVVLYMSGNVLASLKTAVRYHQLYAMMICMIALLLPHQNNRQIKSWLASTAYFFLMGVLLFSGGIYISSFTGVAGFLLLTPIGGIVLMAGWGCLIRTALLRTR